MTAGWMHRQVTDGTARGRRLGYALAPRYVVPQERTLADRLALLAATADLIRFPGTEGTWARLFADEPAVIMGQLLAVQPEGRRIEFAAAVEAEPALAAADLQAFARQVAAWLTRAAGPGRRLFAAQLEAIDGRAPLTELVRQLAEAEDGRPAALAALVQAATAAPVPKDAIGRARAARDALVRGHDVLLNIVAALRPGVERAFEARLVSGQIDPALGLILAELRLLGEVEERVNRFTDRHADYYFRDVLGQEPRPASPETVLLRFAPGAAPVAIGEGAGVLARAEGSTALQHYRLVEGLRVAPVKIAEVRSLRFHRDPLISPQSEMGFVTGLSLATLKPDGGPGDRLFPVAAQTGVAMGLAIASPMLLLGEGCRGIEVRLDFVRRQEREAPAAGGTAAAAASVVLADPAPFAPFGLAAPDATSAAVAGWAEQLAAETGPAPVLELVYHACLRAATTPEQVQAIYGRIVAATLIEGLPWPAGAYRETLLARVSEHLGGQPAASVAAGLLGRRRAEAFQALLHDAFEVALTGEAGPHVVETARVTPNDTGPGVTFHLSLGETAPAIVTPPGAAAPELIIRMAGEGRVCPFSLFEPFALEGVGIVVRVEGLTRLVGFSDDGPLNAAQPFMPFGARPKDGATFLVGAPELAAKPVTQVAVNLAWAGLPRSAGGFETHYRDYGSGFRAPEPTLALAYLTGEGWKQLGEPAPMVRRSAPGGPLLPRLRLEAPIPGRPVAAPGAPADFQQRHSIRAGLASLVLGCPGEALGHAAYPGALAQSMRPTLRPMAQRPVPPPPWTPMVSEISLDYTAAARIVLDAPQAARPGERVAQIGPFGVQEIFPSRDRHGAGLFPARVADGTLFVRVEGQEATGPVSLLFEMEASGQQRTAFRPEPVAWRYLTAAGWQPLPSWSLVSDSTDGLMRSGVVTIDVPDEDVLLQGGEMPGAGVWLAASAARQLDAFPRLVSLTPNGGRAERVDPGEGGAPGAARSFALDPPRPGLGAIVQVGPTIGGAPAESPGEFRARVAERLRHRQRAVTAWDVERLVLDAFPQVWKAKCFPALGPGGRPEPGSLTVVVVPAAPDDAGAAPGQARMFDVLMLRWIEAWLAERASPFAHIEVRNPSYERLQLRGKVGFVTTGDGGTLLRRLKLDVSRFLAVWTAAPPMDGFGWSLNLNDVAALIAGLGYVRFLTEFSVLHLVADDAGSYRLFDTARAGDTGAEQVLGFREPWSLPLPMPDHWITAAHEEHAASPSVTGIGGLGVGETLVVERTEQR